MKQDRKTQVYRGYKITTYRRRSKKYVDYRLSKIEKPDGTEMDLVALGFAHIGESSSGTKIMLRSNIADSHEGCLEYIAPHIDADIDDLVYVPADTLNGAGEWLPRAQAEYIDCGPGLRKYWTKKDGGEL